MTLKPALVMYGLSEKRRAYTKLKMSDLSPSVTPALQGETSFLTFNTVDYFYLFLYTIFMSYT